MGGRCLWVRGGFPESFLADSDAWLTGALQAARMRGSGAGAAALTRVQELLGQWAEISDRSQG